MIASIQPRPPVSRLNAGLRLAGAAIAFVAGCLSAWSADFKAAQAVVGLVLPSATADADSVRRGALLAVEQANQVQGRAAALVVRGRHGQWGTDGEDAAALALDDQVGALITPANGATAHQILQVAGRTRVPVASLCPDSSVTRSGIPWVIRFVPGTEDEAQAIFATLATNGATPLRHWGAIVPSERAGREVARDLLAAARVTGCHLEPPLALTASSVDMTAPLQRLLARHPNAILLWAEAPTAAKLARQLRQLGFAGVLAGPSWLRSPAFVQAAGAVGRGVLVAEIKPDDREAARLQAFRQTFQTRFGREPDHAAMQAYDAAALLVRVLREAGSEPAYRQFPLRRGYPGVLGELRFDATGRRMVTLEVSVCADSRSGRDGTLRRPYPRSAGAASPVALAPGQEFRRLYRRGRRSAPSLPER